jgi:general secretion pathway protein K
VARGSALLTVLWLSAALSAIAFALATTVRGESERTSTALEGTRAYFLAAGAIERGVLYMQWGQAFAQPGGIPRFYSPGTPVLVFPFPSGEAQVEVIPESAKININEARPEELYSLLLHLGAGPERAREIALGIVDWRTAAPGGVTPYDQYYLSLVPSFRARHSSFQEIEELLLVKGMTPNLFYGTYESDAEGRLIPRGALKDCVSVYGSGGTFDVNTAEPAVLLTAGLTPEMVAAIVQARRTMPFRAPEQLGAFLQGAPGSNRLRIGGNSIFTLRATARLRQPNGTLSDQRRSAAAVVQLTPVGNRTYQVLRWYDTAWVR